MLDKVGRDEMHYKIAHINIKEIENKEDVLKAMKKIKNPNFQDKQGVSYLHMACQAHSIEAVSLLLELGADPNINDDKDFSPIMSAIGRINENNSAIFELLLQHGLDLDKKEGNMTLKEMIESFDEEELNNIMRKYAVSEELK
ncbi:MAG: ankyrin repeat domain-containing protein [Lachnospiraceae bacterium]|nr:ankyrin repeat domain-containing protein [Lachnospiraceae bacterium]